MEMDSRPTEIFGSENAVSEMTGLHLAAYRGINDWYCPYGVQTGDGPDTCKPKPKPMTPDEQRRLHEAVEALNKSICPYGVQTGDGPDTCKPKPKPPTPEERRRMKDAIEALNKSICPYGVQTGSGPDTCKPKPKR